MIKRFFSKLAIYILLICGSAIFLVPLFWMMSTALKPIDQTMSMPPSWIAYRLFADFGGKQVSVKTGETITTPSLIVTTQAGEKKIVSPDQVVKGKLVGKNKTGEKIKTPVTVLKEIPASAEQPWIRIIPEEAMIAIQAGKGNATLSTEWDFVRADSLRKERALRCCLGPVLHRLIVPWTNLTCMLELM